MSTLKQLKGRGTRVVTSPNHTAEDGAALTYTIRRLSALELEEIGVSAIIKIDVGSMIEGTPKADVQVADMIAAARRALERAVIDPRIRCDEAALSDPEVLHISEIAPDDVWLFSAILEFSGLTATNKRRLDDLAKNPTGSESTTGSPDATAVSRPNSLDSEPLTAA